MLFPGGLAISSEGGLLLLTAATSLRLGGLTFSWLRRLVVCRAVGFPFEGNPPLLSGGTLYPSRVAPLSLGGFTSSEARCFLAPPALFIRGANFFVAALHLFTRGVRFYLLTSPFRVSEG